MTTLLRLALVTFFITQIYCHVIDDCILGEDYWCISIANAKKCQKLELCFPSSKPNDYIKKKPVADVRLPQDEVPVIKDNPYGGYIG